MERTAEESIADEVLQSSADAAIGASNGMSWYEQGACRGTNAALFHTSRGSAADIKAAKAICNDVCNVRELCLEYALGQPEHQDFGVWGGTSQKERKGIRKQRRAMARAALKVATEE